MLISSNQNIPPNTTLFFYLLFTAGGTQYAACRHFHAVFLQAKSRSFSPLRACRDWDLSHLYTPTICSRETNNQTCVTWTFYWLIYLTHNGMKYIKVKSPVLRGILSSVELHDNILFVLKIEFQSARHCILGQHTCHLLWSLLFLYNL